MDEEKCIICGKLISIQNRTGSCKDCYNKYKKKSKYGGWYVEKSSRVKMVIKLEPLKGKLIDDNQCVTDDVPKYVSDFFYVDDVLSAVEWLKSFRVVDIIDTSNLSKDMLIKIVDFKFYYDKLINEAFYDVIEHKEHNHRG